MFLSFLNAVFEDSGQSLIVDVELLNPFLGKDALTDKQGVLDVKARTQAGTLMDVEIRFRNHQDMEKRTLFYWVLGKDVWRTTRRRRKLPSVA